MTDNSGQAPAGWYPDPDGTSRQRYFDGELWTEHYHDTAAQPAAATAQPGAAAMGGGGYIAQGAAPVALSPFGYWKKVVFENYANFSGRARRAEFWWSYLITIAIMVVLVIIGALLGDAGIVLPVLFILGMVIPLLASVVRRLHDTGKSGWYYFIGMIPIVGGIILYVFLGTDGERGPNQYGPSPKY